MMVAFCCTHVASGAAIWQVTRCEAKDGMPESLDVTCRVCTGLPESSFTADDVVVLDPRHIEGQIDRLLEPYLP
jgi:hypothetical protein